MILLKIESKTQQDNKKYKRFLNFKSNHFSFLSNLDSIIYSFARNKRLKHINTLLNQSTFKPKSFISLTTFISSLLFISSN